MSDIHMHTGDVVAASQRLVEGDEELRPEPKLGRAASALTGVSHGATDAAWPSAAEAISEAFQRFRGSNNDLQHKLVSSAHLYEKHERVNTATIRSIEA